METSLEIMRKQTLSLGHPVTNHVIIIDLDGISLKKTTSKGIMMITRKIIKLCSGEHSMKNHFNNCSSSEIANYLYISRFIHFSSLSRDSKAYVDYQLRKNVQVDHEDYNSMK